MWLFNLFSWLQKEVNSKILRQMDYESVSKQKCHECQSQEEYEIYLKECSGDR